MESVPCSMVNGEIAPGKVTDTQSSAGSAKRGSELVISEKFLLRVNEKSNGSLAWDQLRLVWDPVDHQ